MRFSEYIVIWAKYRKGSDSAWKCTQDGMIQNHILPIIGKKRLNKISDADISDVLASVRDKGLSSQTERHVYNILKQSFHAAVVRFKHIKESPVSEEFHCRPVVNKQPPFLDRESAWILLEYLFGDDKWGILVWLQIAAGLRVGEAIGVRWMDVDFDSNKIHVRNVWNKNNRRMQGHRKNGGQFSVPMIPDLRKKLARIAQKDGYVARGPEGDHLSYEGYKTFLRRLPSEFKKHLRSSHGCRHTTSEVWHTATQEQLRELLGHDSVRSTERYFHRPSDGLQSLASGVRRKGKAA